MRAWVAVALAALVLAGCNQSTPVARSSPRPSQTPVSTSPAGQSPSPAVDFSCRLPVVTSDLSQAGVNYQGGFVEFPQGTYSADPAGRMLARESDVVTTATPILAGDGGTPFYNRALSRWIPARSVESLPDGSQYAYVTVDRNTNIFTVHVTTARTASSRAFTLNSAGWNGWAPWVVDFTAAGVYLVGTGGIGGPGERVLLLDPASGALRELGQIHAVWTARNGYAWVARFDPRDKTIWGPMEIAPQNSLVQINLSTGAETEWFYRAGTYPWFDGLDASGHPILEIPTASGKEVRLIDRPGDPGRLIYRIVKSDVAYAQGDRDRLWFGSYDGIYVYTPSLGFRKVFAWNGDASNGERIEPAGFCL